MKDKRMRKCLVVGLVMMTALTGCALEGEDADTSQQNLRPGQGSSPQGWQVQTEPQDAADEPTSDEPTSDEPPCETWLEDLGLDDPLEVVVAAREAFERCVSQGDETSGGGHDAGSSPCALSMEADGRLARACQVQDESSCEASLDELPEDATQAQIEAARQALTRCLGQEYEAHPEQERCELLRDESGRTIKVCVPADPSCQYVRLQDGLIVLECQGDAPDAGASHCDQILERLNHTMDPQLTEAILESHRLCLTGAEDDSLDESGSPPDAMSRP